MSSPIDPELLALVEQVMAGARPNRVKATLQALLDKGWVSTDEISEMGYGHPPRAACDIRDAGIPLITSRATSEKTGKRMAVYRLGDVSLIQEGRIGGRSSLPKKFKAALVQRYGSVDCITGALLNERVLQIDHRVPYRIAGDAGLADHNVEAYMLLDASSQRGKSWSCENCPNMAPAVRKPEVCGTCFWAYPEKYNHIAMVDIRRTDIAWQGDDVAVHDRLKAMAEKSGGTIGDILKATARQMAKDA